MQIIPGKNGRIVMCATLASLDITQGQTINRLGKRHETCYDTLSISEALSESGLPLLPHPPTAGPVVCYGGGWTKPLPGECTAGVWSSRTKVVCSVRRPVHFYSNMKCTHKAQKVHGKSCYG